MSTHNMFLWRTDKISFTYHQIPTLSIPLLIKCREIEEASDKEPDIWPHWMAAHACLKEFNLHIAKIPFLMRWLKYTIRIGMLKKVSSKTNDKCTNFTMEAF